MVTDKKRDARLEMRAQMLKALAHPTRLLIVEELGKGERCVCEFQQMIGADMSTVSKHLTLLKNAGVIVDRRAGNQVFYSLQTPCILSIFACVEKAARSSLSKRARDMGVAMPEDDAPDSCDCKGSCPEYSERAAGSKAACGSTKKPLKKGGAK